VQTSYGAGTGKNVCGRIDSASLGSPYYPTQRISDDFFFQLEFFHMTFF
jgi:hypothetical protein